MQTALDRLLTSPSALRVLRTLVNTPELSSTCFPPANRRHMSATRRQYSSKPKPQKLRIWKYDNGGKEGKKLAPLPAHFNDPVLHNLGKLDLDSVPITEKAQLWVEALLYHERVHGLGGVRRVLLGMERRGYHFPAVDTPDAATLWSTLLKRKEIVIPVLDDATRIQKETGQLYPRLYEICMTHWLPRHPRLALQYHHHMVLKLQLKKLPLRSLAELARTKFRAESLEAFMDIYRMSNERDIYDMIVPVLCDQGQITTARRWHMLCTHRKDLPSPSAAAHPIVKLFIAEFSAISAPNATELIAQDQGTTFKRIATVDSVIHKKPKYNEELMRRLTGRDMAPVRFDDPFCARLFATRAFPPATIIQGLVLVGVNEIGPLALRAMGLKTEPLSELPERFRELRAVGIALQGSVFSLALEKFAMEGQFHLVRSMLDSDQHPDVFGDADVQKKLLDYYLEQEDWVQAHRTLAVLALFHNDPSTQAWNILLQARVKHFNPVKLIQLLQDMRVHEVLVSGESMATLRTILRRRQPGRRPAMPSQGKFDDLRFLSRIYIMILESGIGQVYPKGWSEIIRRYGMLGRFRELKRLLFWLLSWYAPRSDPAFARLPKSPFLDAATARMRKEFPERYEYFNVSSTLSQKSKLHPVRRLLPGSLQQALVIWGFQAGLLPHAAVEQTMLIGNASKKHFRRKFLKRGVLRPLDWSVGLRTLVEMRDYGVHVHRHDVIKALQMQFIVLFGGGRSDKLANRIMQRVNTIPYDEYVRKVNDIWGSPLFREASLFGSTRVHGMMWHPKFPRMVKRRTHLQLDEIVGDGWRRSNTGETGNTNQMDAESAVLTTECNTPTATLPTQGQADVVESSDDEPLPDASGFDFLTHDPVPPEVDARPTSTSADGCSR